MKYLYYSLYAFFKNHTKTKDPECYATDILSDVLFMLTYPVIALLFDLLDWRIYIEMIFTFGWYAYGSSRIDQYFFHHGKKMVEEVSKKSIKKHSRYLVLTALFIILSFLQAIILLETEPLIIEKIRPYTDMIRYTHLFTF